VRPDAAEALESVRAGLDFLVGADVASWPAEALADWLRAFGQLEAVQVAAQARVLAAFNAQGGYEADGQATART